MFKLSKVGIAAVLGLTLVFSAFGSGAFAQSINQNSIHEVVQMTVKQGQTGQNWTAKHYPMSNQQGNRWHNGCGWHMNCHKPVVHKRCVRVVRWIKFGHTTRRVVSWVCRR
jgi:hypothetical protein